MFFIICNDKKHYAGLAEPNFIISAIESFQKVLQEWRAIWEMHMQSLSKTTFDLFYDSSIPTN